MEFFTALVMVYQLRNTETELMIWFEDYDTCYEAQYAADDLYHMAQGTQMFCLESDVASRSIAPKLRPKVQSEERL